MNHTEDTSIVDDEKNNLLAGRLNRNLHPSFWLWALLEKCNRIRTTTSISMFDNDKCTDDIAIVPLDADNEKNEVDVGSSTPPLEDLEVPLVVP